MKKTKILTSLALANVAITPVFFATACSQSKPYEALRKEIYEQAIKEFKEICKYPRRTGYTKPVFNYLKTLIESLGYEFHNDNYDSGTGQGNGNIWFDVPATEGMENVPMLALQAHMDMVLAGADDAAIEKAKVNGIEPFETTIDGRPVIISKDRQTSLGADDGIGLSIVLAIAKNKNLAHGPLRMIITTDEEGTTAGALNFGKDVEGGAEGILAPVNSLLNLDDEEQHQLTISAAGNSTSTISLPNLALATDLSNYTYVMEISGLKGGHSGDHINDSRHNANKVVVDIFESLQDDSVQLVSYSNPGMTACNTIPSTAKVVFRSNSAITLIQPTIDAEIEKIKKECELDKDVKIVLSSSYSSKSALTNNETSNFINLLKKLRHGVKEWITEPDLPKTSQNLALVNLDSDAATGTVQLMTRSSVDEQIHEIENENKNAAETYFEDKFDIAFTPATHGWTAADDDLMTKLVMESHKQQGVETTLLKCHAGIECAEFAKYKPSLNLGCIGPKIDDAHSTQETVYLDTLDHLIWTVLFVIEHIQNK